MIKDSSQLWEEALRRLKTGEERIKLATKMCQKGNYEEAILKTHHAVYHTARAILYAKQVEPATDSELIEEFGLNFLQSGIIDKEDVKPYLTFRRGYDDKRLEGKILSTDKEKAMHLLSDAKNFIKDVEKYIKREIKRRKKLCQS